MMEVVKAFAKVNDRFKCTNEVSVYYCVNVKALLETRTINVK